MELARVAAATVTSEGAAGTDDSAMAVADVAPSHSVPLVQSPGPRDFQPGTHDHEASTSKTAHLLATPPPPGNLSPSFNLRAPDYSSDSSDDALANTAVPLYMASALALLRIEWPQTTIGTLKDPYSSAVITGYLSFIESLSSTNFKKWEEQISIILEIMDLDYTLRVNGSVALTAESSTEQMAVYKKWERSNHLSLIIMKGSIMTAIRGAIPDSDNAKLYLTNIEDQFQGSSKAHATTLIIKIVTLKYNRSNDVREHILRMNDMTSQLKGLDMEISKDSNDLEYGVKMNQQPAYVANGKIVGQF
ncbi:hypothetical protein RJ639_019268 [Escallonia herrerae]|uniref:UBN2_2 domain-containing protein n=1 Tax=Escallonia herrerae TaxID=1293975 RepID=A0AA89AHD8_9ASTE|nr:hypothetical protein RJ639_019268 [Escallonia herrerae]